MKKKIFLSVSITVIIFFTTICVFGSGWYVMTYFPGTTDTVMNIPEAERKTPEESYSVSSQIPQRTGYEFLGWVLDYGSALYKVEYVVNPDPIYGVPENVAAPIDTTQYTPGEVVKVEEPLTTIQDFGINVNSGEERPGIWTFILWDRTDFEIYEDTTITGEWKFISKYKYTVHHLDIDTYDQLAADEVIWIDELGQVGPKSKKPTTEFFTKYQKSKYSPVTENVYMNKRADFLLPGAEYTKNKTQYIITVTLTEDDQQIFFFYQRGGAL